MRPFTAPNAGAVKNRKKNRKILSGEENSKLRGRVNNNLGGLGPTTEGEAETDVVNELPDEGLPVSQEIL